MLSSSGREAAMFTVAGLFPVKPVMLLMPCHMLLGLLLLKCSLWRGGRGSAKSAAGERLRRQR